MTSDPQQAEVQMEEISLEDPSSVQDENIENKEKLISKEEMAETIETEQERIEKATKQSGFGADYIKSALFGGLDGITTVFVSVATVYSGNVATIVVLIIGLAKLLSGAISMGVGDFMSSKAELELIRTELKRETWECENFLKGEKDEMVEIYHAKGLNRNVADKMVDIMSTNKKAFVDVMMVQELGLQPKIDPYAPLKNGLVNFGSFMFFGIIPLIIYIILAIVGVEFTPLLTHVFFGVDAVITVIALLVMGYVKSRYSDQRWWLSMIVTLIVGIIAAGSGYITALILEKVFHFNNVG